MLIRLHPAVCERSSALLPPINELRGISISYISLHSIVHADRFTSNFGDNSKRLIKHHSDWHFDLQLPTPLHQTTSPIYIHLMAQGTTIAFFGATGDSAGYCLAAALRNEYACTALARTPSKLTTSLTTKGISPETQVRFLTIVQGDVRDPEPVKQTLRPGGKTVDIIVSGVGATAFYLHPNPLAPIGIQDSTICRDASRSILAALEQNQNQQGSGSGSGSQKPLLINISTTGIAPPGKPRDVPLLWLPLYRWLLHHPHVDKAEMEANLRAVMAKEERPLRGYVNVKPTLLSGGEGIGWERVRFGVDDEPAVGYFVARKDVGEWIFERLVRREWGVGWEGNGVCLAN